MGTDDQPERPPNGATGAAASEGDRPNVEGVLLVDADTVAKLLSISKSSLHAFNATGQLPKPVRLGRAVRWNLEELKAWVNCGCPSRYRWETLRSHFGFGTEVRKGRR